MGRAPPARALCLWLSCMSDCKVFDQRALQVGNDHLGGDGADTGEDFSGAKSFLERGLLHRNTPLSSCGGKMDGERQGGDRSLGNDGFGP